ncbi:methyltransferase [Cryptosporangium aurantiacum]|uniref:Methyltransferase small domain-containing protein n=1 Tax=Cryptosporangium aurantiacum TaxID=134849 RepID=A0A1M7N4A3_9ACTN|nr:class I SAM-dependent methyltransferase [Cryptosporangium aurantiacum]SHM98256.1 Methyltransferase small domain-containing protein [Cryptosporangium aurantiacum]
MTLTAPAKTGRDQALVQLGQALEALDYTFTTVTPATHERVNRRPANAWAHDLRGALGWSRPFRPDTLPPSIVELMDAAGVLCRDGDTWRSRVRFSSYDNELFVHSAFPTAAADAVFFGPDTYRMADAAAAHVESWRGRPIRRAVDIGCGTGAGAITVAKRAPNAEVLAVDINDTALRYAGVNAALAGTDGVRPCRSNLLHDVSGDFDLIVSNPPFMVDPAGRAYRDGGGADGHALSLDIIDLAAERLNPGGSLVLFSGVGIVDGHDSLRAAAAARLADTDLAWTYREVDPDVYDEELDGDAYANAERIAVVLLTAVRAE